MTKVLVVKCGSNVVAENGGVCQSTLKLIARQVAGARQRGYGVAIVSSGAVACGQKFITNPASTAMRQVASAIGQPVLMRHWQEAFQDFCLTVGQFLETHTAFFNPAAAVLLQSAMHCGIVPIINENDAVSSEEIEEYPHAGDNDMLAAIVAERLGACKLIFLTNVEGLYRPVDGGMELVPVLYEINNEVLQWAGIIPTERKTGMHSKLISARQAMAKGIDVWIANGRKEVIPVILSGGAVGTYCPSLRRQRLPMDMLEHRLVISVSADDYRYRLPASALVIAGLAHKGLRVVDIALVGNDIYTLTIDYSYPENEDLYRAEKRVLRRVESMFGRSFGIKMGTMEPRDPYCMCGV